MDAGAIRRFRSRASDDMGLGARLVDACDLPRDLNLFMPASECIHAGKARPGGHLRLAATTHHLPPASCASAAFPPAPALAPSQSPSVSASVPVTTFVRLVLYVVLVLLFRPSSYSYF